MENSKNSSLSKLIPGDACFFAMGFVDLVGIASNYVKADLGLSDSQANIFLHSSFWFLIFRTDRMLMSRIGQKKTVLLSLLRDFCFIIVAGFGDSYMLMLISSPSGNRKRVDADFSEPVALQHRAWRPFGEQPDFRTVCKRRLLLSLHHTLPWGATQAIPSFDLGWRILFLIYMIVAVVAILLLNVTQIKEEKEEGKPSTFGQCLALLGKPFILLCFIGIMCHVGIDVGTNTTALKILMERLGMDSTTRLLRQVLFIFRTAGCFLGSFILRKMSREVFLRH